MTPAAHRPLRGPQVGSPSRVGLCEVTYDLSTGVLDLEVSGPQMPDHPARPAVRGPAENEGSGGRRPGLPPASHGRVGRGGIEGVVDETADALGLVSRIHTHLVGGLC